MEKAQLIKIDCPICGIDTPYDVKYEANFQLDSLDFAAKKIRHEMIRIVEIFKIFISK